MKFTLIHPTMSRPQKSFETIKKWNLQRCKCGIDIEIIVCLNSDDPKLAEYCQEYTKYDYLLIIGEFRNVVQAVNAAAKEATGDVFIVVSDDTEPAKMWDMVLKEAIGDKKDFVLKTWDGIQNRIVTMMVMDREYYNRDKRVFDPDLAHSWSDTLATELAAKRGRLIIRNDIHFPHNHYSVTGEQPDELYKRNDLTHDRDRHIYQAKMKTL